MIEKLTSHRRVAALVRRVRSATESLASWQGLQDRGALVFRFVLGAYFAGMGLFFAGTLGGYRRAASDPDGIDASSIGELPSVIPLVFQGIGLVLAAGAFLLSLWFGRRRTPVQRRALVVVSLSLASVGALVAWLPTDVIETRSAIMGRAPAGEIPSIGAYLGLLALVSTLILSIPVAAFVYFRLGLMDRYVVHNFLHPFALCLFSFIAIWILHDLTDNGDLLAMLPLSQVVNFYLTQTPFVVLFVLPIAVLLSGLFALSRMSKANEFISMIGSGRSVLRILAPLLVTGAYVSLVALAFKYQWAPAANGFKEAVIETAKREQWLRRHGQGGGEAPGDSLWAHRGWMHVSEADHRSWFVGRVPLVLSDPMSEVIVTQLDDEDQPVQTWVARRARWVWDAKPPRWILNRVRIYRYGEDRVPRIETVPQLVIEDWNETPWKVLSSSQSPEHLGFPGLTMYLRANHDLDEGSLAPFRTNRWFIFAEPLACFAMILVAAPLGIVYSRRGVMAGVTGAIALFALLYLLQNTFLALGHSGRMSPFPAATLANFIVGGIGVVLLHYRSRNRELPKPKALLKTLFRRPARAGTPA